MSRQWTTDVERVLNNGAVLWMSIQDIESHSKGKRQEINRTRFPLEFDRAVILEIKSMAVIHQTYHDTIRGDSFIWMADAVQIAQIDYLQRFLDPAGNWAHGWHEHRYFDWEQHVPLPALNGFTEKNFTETGQISPMRVFEWVLTYWNIRHEFRGWQ